MLENKPKCHPTVLARRCTLMPAILIAMVGMICFAPSQAAARNLLAQWGHSVLLGVQGSISLGEGNPNLGLRYGNAGIHREGLAGLESRLLSSVSRIIDTEHQRLVINVLHFQWQPQKSGSRRVEINLSAVSSSGSNGGVVSRQSLFSDLDAGLPLGSDRPLDFSDRVQQGSLMLRMTIRY